MPAPHRAQDQVADQRLLGNRSRRNQAGGTEPPDGGGAPGATRRWERPGVISHPPGRWPGEDPLGPGHEGDHQQDQRPQRLQPRAQVATDVGDAQSR